MREALQAGTHMLSKSEGEGSNAGRIEDTRPRSVGPQSMGALEADLQVAEVVLARSEAV